MAGCSTLAHRSNDMAVARRILYVVGAALRSLHRPRSTTAVTLSAIPRADGGDFGSPLTQVVAAAHEVLPHFISSVVDAGAGIGDTVNPLRSIGEDITVTAYEPLPENIRVLNERFVDIPNVRVRPVAISDAAGSARFAVPSRLQQTAGAWAAGTSYNGFLLRPHSPESWARAALCAFGAIRRRLSGQRPSSDQVMISVPTVRLDAEFSEAPDAIKMDLQGGEIAALRGAGQLISAVKLLQLEVQFLRESNRVAITQLLQAHNFILYVGDLQFSVPSLTDGFRMELKKAGVEIDLELNGGVFGADVLIIGRWSSRHTLPFDGCHLAPTFVKVLQRAKVIYFQTDLIALNGRYKSEWPQILSHMDGSHQVTPSGSPSRTTQG